MKEALKYWWLVLIEGIILIVLSFFIFGHPVGALLGLTWYIGIVLMVKGVMLVIYGISNRAIDDHWGWKLAGGIIDVIFSLILLANPAVSVAVFPFVVGFWLIFSGAMVFAGAFAVKKSGDKSWWMNLVGGIIIVVLGYIIMNDWLAGAFAITFWIGTGFMLAGIMSISAAFRMKKLKAEAN